MQKSIVYALASDSVLRPNALSTRNGRSGDGVGASVRRQISRLSGSAHRLVITPCGSVGVHESTSEDAVHPIRVPRGDAAVRWADNWRVVGGMRAFARIGEEREGGSESGSVGEGVDLLRTIAYLFSSVGEETGVKVNEFQVAMLL